jgi:hypothetical protein
MWLRKRLTKATVLIAEEFGKAEYENYMRM